MKKYFPLCLVLLLLFACKKNNNSVLLNPEIQSSDLTKTTQQQIAFAKILATAVHENKELRNFLKHEALKMFDNDYDILYHNVKTSKVGNESVAELLSKYAGSNAKLDSIVGELPLLTIFIPTLPSNFSPQSWNSETEVPLVAVRQPSTNEIPFYDHNGKEYKISSEFIPGFPLLVVKQNERIKVSNNLTSSRSVENNSSENPKYEFIDEIFDKTKNILEKSTNSSLFIPQSNKNSLNKLTSSRAVTDTRPVYAMTGNTDATAVTAYENNYDWQRDYIYYGLTPNVPSGKLKRNYSEFLTSFRFYNDNAAEAFSKISDQSPDPSPMQILTPTQYNTGPYWTDGYFEFQVDVLINGINGAGQTLTKYFSASPLELFDLQYESFTMPFTMYRVKSIESLQGCYPNLELVPWDLQSYGMAWKFKISERDPSEERTYSEESTSTFAMNFDLDVSGQVSENVKVGMKFGLSSTTTHKSTFTQKYLLNSDDLGEAILTFDQPVIIGKSNFASGPAYHIRAITSGWYGITIEPKKVY